MDQAAHASLAQFNGLHQTDNPVMALESSFVEVAERASTEAVAECFFLPTRVTVGARVLGRTRHVGA